MIGLGEGDAEQGGYPFQGLPGKIVQFLLQILQDGDEGSRLRWVALQDPLHHDL
jgi:hypothetical protein